VRDRDEVDAAFREIEAALGPVEILVTSAGVFRPTPLLELDAESWRRTMEINLTGTFNCLQRAAASMCEGGWGRIVTISSGAGIDGGTEECADYAASKGGVIALTKAASKELVRSGITVNCVAPRAVATQMLGDLEDDLAARAPVGRVGTVDDVAAGVAFLCSAHASYVTGEVLVMNGGLW
jgi:2-hydroxycyclohexanecarboxyl-CoA dehydrogenase